MITSLDKYGRILIPKKLREILGITPETPLNISIQGGKIMLEPISKEYPYVEKDGLLVYVGELEGEYNTLLEEERSKRDDEILGI